MLQRTLMTALTVLGASMSFAMNSAGALSLAKPIVPISPTTELKIYELFINAPSSSGSDNGKEYIEIKNTSASTMSIEDVYLVYIDGETAEQGEVDVLLRLGTQGGVAGTIGGNGARSLAPGEVLVIRDTVSGSPVTINPNGGTVVSLDFDSRSEFNSDPLKNSCGMFALVTGVSGIAPGDHKDTTPANGILDSTYWTNTLDVVDIRADAGATYYSNSTLNGSGFDKVQCAQQSTWTPDGFSRLVTGTSYTQGLIYDIVDGANPPTFVPAIGSEYTFAVNNFTTPVTVSGTVACTPGLSGQFSVKNGAMGATTWTH